MRVATYTRISTDEEHQPYSLEAQAERLRSYIASQDGWELVRSFTDQASGATTDRPQLQRALTEARAHRFDLLLVYRVDRFSRSVRGLAHLLEELDAAGVGFRSATEPFDTTTPAGRMMVQMLAVFAEFERATIIDRVISGMERKAARGEWTAGGPPYGYEVDPTTGYLRVKEDEASLVPIIFDLYLRRRLGAKAVAGWLNERGHRTKYGRPWSHMAVLTVLRNRTYLGEVYLRGRWHPAPHPPLVDADVSAKVADLLAQRGEDHSRRAANASDYLLAGLVICGKCGKRFVGTAATGNRYRYKYYTCFSRQRYGEETCPAERLPAEELDDAVLDALLATYERSDVFEEAVAGARNRAMAIHDQQEAELAKIEAELRKTEEAVERYLLAFEAGTLPEAQCGERVRTLTAKAADLRVRREELVVLLDESRLQAPTEQELADARAEIRKVRANGDAPARKAVLQNLVHEVRADSRQVITPTFRVPTPTPVEAKVRKLSGSVRARGLEPPPPEGTGT